MCRRNWPRESPRAWGRHQRRFHQAVGAEDSSALFVLFRKLTLDRVVPDLEKYQGTVLRTSLSIEQKQALCQALAQHLAKAA